MQNSKRKLNQQLNGVVKIKKSSMVNLIKTEASILKTENSLENFSVFQSNINPQHRKFKTSFKLPQINLLENFQTQFAAPLSERRHQKKFSINYVQLTSRQSSNTRVEFISPEQKNLSIPLKKSNYNQSSNQQDVGVQKVKDFSDNQNQISLQQNQQKNQTLQNFRQQPRNSIQKIVPQGISDQQKQIFQKKISQWQSTQQKNQEQALSETEVLQKVQNQQNSLQLKNDSGNQQMNEKTIQKSIEIQDYDQQSLSTNEQSLQDNKSIRFKNQYSRGDQGLEEICPNGEVRTSEREIRPKKLSEIQELRSRIPSEQGEIRSKKTSEIEDVTKKKLPENEEAQKQGGDPEGEIRSKKISEVGEIRSKKQSESEIRSKKISETEIRSKKPSEIGEIRSKQNSKDMRSKASSWFSQSSCGTQRSDESHYVFDNTDLQIRGIDFQDLEKKDTIQQFLSFYKMRFGGFPNQHQTISNEEVIKVALNFAKANRKMFRKYFPSNRIIFEDENDYSKEHQITSDPNYLKFVDYVSKYQQGDEINKLESIQEVNEMHVPEILDRRKGLKSSIGLKSHNKLQACLVKFDKKKGDQKQSK